MADREKVINGLNHCFHGQECCGDTECPYYIEHLSDSCCLEDCQENLKADVIAMLKEQQNLLGIQQTADSITFISSGTAQQGEERGLMLGKLTMHEWLEKELLYRGLLTDEIRAVFNEAKRI